jgi:MerR family regulatory protein
MAERTGVTLDTLRYYEKENLLIGELQVALGAFGSSPWGLVRCSLVGRSMRLDHRP